VKPDLLLLIITILVALIFDFLNGFHDARQQYCDCGVDTRSCPKAGCNVGRVL